MAQSKLGLGFAVIGFCLAACSSTLAPKAAREDGMTREQYRAAYDIASARCDRQTSACSSYASRDACIEDKLRASAADTRLPRCSNEVDPTEVRACVSQISQGRCGTGILQLQACKKSALCPYQSEEGTF